MILVTTEQVPGKQVEKSLGVVRGNTVRAKHIGRDIVALLRNLVGVRFITAQISAGSAELLAYGTAVKLHAGDPPPRRSDGGVAR